MSINIGEVQAVLTARNQMSPEFVQAAEDVLRLRKAFSELGTAGTEEITKVTNALAEATARFETLRDKNIAVQQATQAAAAASVEQTTALKAQTDATLAAASAQDRLNAARAAGFNPVPGSPLPQGGTYVPSGGPGAMTAGTIADAAAANERLQEVTGEQYILQIQRMSSAMLPLTEQQREWMGLLKDSGQLTQANAEKIGVNVIQYREWTQEMKNAGGAMKLTGDALMASLQGMSEPVTREQALMLNQMREMNMLTQANAEAIGVNAVQYKQFTQSLKEGEAAARANSQSLAQMSGMVLRLVENMAVFYVMYKGGEAIAEFFTYVQSIANLHEQTGMSISKLQEVGYAATQTGGTIEKLTTYVGHLNEALGKMTPQTGDVLREIGLNWEQVFNLQPDERFDAIAKAISGIEDPMRRAAIETQLFGSEAIDPLIMKLDELEKQAPKMEDATINATHNTIQLYKGLAAEIFPILAEWIEKGQKLVEIFASPLFGGGPQNINEYRQNQSTISSIDAMQYVPGAGFVPGLMKLWSALTYKGQGLDLTNGALGLVPYSGPDVGPNMPGETAPPPHPPIGQDYINYLKETQGALVPLTSAQRVFLDQLREMNLLDREHVEKGGLGITLSQFNAYKEGVQEATKWLNAFNREQEKYAEAFRNLNSGGTDWRNTINDIAGPVVELGKYYLDAQGKSAMPDMIRVFGQDYGLTEAQVRAIGDAWDYDQKQQKAYVADTEKATQSLIRYQGDYNTYSTKATQDNYDARRAAADAWFNDELFKLGKLTIDEGTFYSTLAGLALAHSAKIAAINDDEMDHYAKSLGQLNVLWDQYYSAIEEDSGTAMTKKIADVEKWADAQRKAIAANDPLADDKLVAIQAVVDQRITNIQRSFDPLWQAWRTLNEDFRNEWAKTWDIGLQDAKKFSDALTAPFDTITDMFRKMIAGLLADWEQRLLAPMFNWTQQVLASIFGMPATSSGGMSGGTTAALGMGGYLSGMDGAGALGPGGEAVPGGFVGPMMDPSSGMSNSARYGGGAMLAGAGALTLFTAQNRSQATMGGLEMGAGIGTMIMPGIGTAIGAGAGALFGYLYKVFGDRTLQDLARDAGEKFGQDWSESLQKKIKTYKEQFNDEVAGELFGLGDILKEHPATTANVNMYLDRLHDVFSMVETGKFTIEDANKAISDTFEDLAAKSVDYYGFVSQKLKDIVDLNRQFGLQNDDIAAWQHNQALAAQSGFVQIMGAEQMALEGWDKIKEKVDEAQKAIDDFVKDHPDEKVPKNLLDALAKAKVPQASEAARNKDELGDLGIQAIGSYAAAVATGSTRLEALVAQSDALTDLEKAYKDLGIAVEDEGLKALFMMNDQYVASKTLITGINGLQTAMVSWQNLGIETADMFAAQERTGYSMYVRLQDQTARLGGTTRDALRPMQDFLHAAAEEAKRLNVPLDENIQRMIDQSKELGIWEDKAQDAKDATQDLADAIHELVNWLKGIPANVNTNINTNYTHTGDPHGSDGTGDGSSDSSNGGGGSLPRSPKPDLPKQNESMGGVIYPESFANGGRVLAFRPVGTDTVPAMLTPNEGIVSVAGMSRIGKSGLDAINSGGSLGGDTYHIQVTIATNATNARELEAFMKKPGGGIDMMITEISRGKRGRATKLKRGMENAA